MDQFISDHRITMDLVAVESNPNMDRYSMDPESNHYQILLKMPTGFYLTFYSQGPGIEDEPHIKDVLSCLATDSASYDCVDTFEEWCEHFGDDEEETAPDDGRPRDLWRLPRGGANGGRGRPASRAGQ